MSRRGKRNETGIDPASMGVTPFGNKWKASWRYHGSTMIFTKVFDYDGLAHNHLLKLQQENKGK